MRLRPHPALAVDRERDPRHALVVAGARFGGIALEALDVGDQRAFPALTTAAAHLGARRGSAATVASRPRASRLRSPSVGGSGLGGSGTAAPPRLPASGGLVSSLAAASPRSPPRAAPAPDRWAASSATPEDSGSSSSRPARRRRDRPPRIGSETPAPCEAMGQHARPRSKCRPARLVSARSIPQGMRKRGHRACPTPARPGRP